MVQPHIYVKDYSPGSSQTVRVSGKTKSKSVNHLRAWREYRGLTQAELAELIGTADNVISLLESGGRRLSDKWLYKLAPALKTRAGFLLEFDPGDVDLEILEAATATPDNRKSEALALLRVFNRTGTDG